MIICTATSCGKTHDLTLFHQPKTAIHPETELIADAGYQGVQRDHKNAHTPHKASKRRALTSQQRRENRALARVRLTVEHVIRRLKVFRVLKETYRHRRRRFLLRLNLLAALHNAMLPGSA